MAALLQGEQDTAAMMALVGDEIGDERNKTPLERPDARGALARQANPLLDPLRGILESGDQSPGEARPHGVDDLSP